MPAPAVRFGAALAAALYMLLYVPAAGLALLLLVHAQTGQARLFATATLVGLPAPVLLWLALYLRRKRATLWTAAGLALAALLLLGLDLAWTAPGHASPGAPVQSHYLGTARYARASPANLVPEIDQLLLGTRVVPLLDPLMDEANTRELRRGVEEVYGAMRHDAEFERLGSVMNLNYRDILLRDRPTGHFYEYIPSAATGRVPVVLFLHGSLGNFRGYLWVWKAMADAGGFAVVAPTFGAGNWDQPGGREAIERMRRYCTEHPRFDPSRLYLAGLSNGGRGACIGAAAAPADYRGLILISPVIDPDLLASPSFVAAWRNKPILVLHGQADNRIPVAYVEGAIAAMKQAGLRVDSQIYPGQTHFLFFTIRAEAGRLITEWLKRG